MIAIWSFQKAFLYPPNGFSSLFYAVAISLFLNPFSILDSGFQYSFLITAFLIGGWRKASYFNGLLNLKSHLKPVVSGTSFFENIISGLISTGAICVVAFLSGLQVSLFNQNIINPLSIIINIIATPFLWGIFFLSFLLLVFPLEILFNVLNFVLDLFRLAMIMFANFAIRIASPPIIPFFVFFSIPLSALVFLRLDRKKTMIFVSFIFVSLAICFALPSLRGAKTYVISGDGRPPVVVALRPEKDFVYIVNASGLEQSRKIIEILSSNGFSSIDRVYCLEALMVFSEGVPYLFSYFNCGNLIFLSNPTLSPYAKIAIQKAGEHLTKVRIEEINTRKKRKRERDSETSIFISKDETLNFFRSRSGQTFIKINTKNGESNIEIENHLRMKVSVFDENTKK